jgi:uncharacterized Zn-binding protein involved in type VI secretion
MAQFPVARLGDVSSHGGIIISSGQLYRDSADGKLVARKGDLHSCPIPRHGITPIVTASSKVRSQGKAVAGITSRCGCGATITTGSSTTVIPIGGATLGDFGADTFIVDDPNAGLMNGLSKIK